MSWAVGWSLMHRRDIGYGVPAYCDHPRCSAEIDRGLAFVCGGEHRENDMGCGLYFCEQHRRWGRRNVRVCSRCGNYRRPFEPKADHPVWLRHKLTDESWQAWRDENPAEVKAMTEALTR